MRRRGVSKPRDRPGRSGAPVAAGRSRTRSSARTTCRRDGLTDAVRVSEAQARRAIEGGARFLGEHTVTDIRTDDGRVRGVITDRGEIPADIVVCAAGIWGPRIGAMVGMTVAAPAARAPAHLDDTPPRGRAFDIPAELEAIHPNIRVQDRDMYYREYPDRLAVGGYGHVPLPVDARGPAPSARRAGHAVRARVHAGRRSPRSWSWAEELVPALRSPEAPDRARASTASSRSRPTAFR